MKYTVNAPEPVTGKGWGLDFVNGVAVTEDADLAGKLASKGYTVTAEAAPELTCPVCGKVYKNEAALKKHMAEKHPDYKPGEPSAPGQGQTPGQDDDPNKDPGQGQE